MKKSREYSVYKAVLTDGKDAKAAPKAAHAEDEKPLSEKTC